MTDFCFAPKFLQNFLQGYFLFLAFVSIFLNLHMGKNNFKNYFFSKLSLFLAFLYFKNHNFYLRLNQFL